MKPGLKSNHVVFVVLGIALLGIGFWMLLLSPKREEVKRLDAQVTKWESSLAAHEAEITAGEAARDRYPSDYQRLVVLGKAVPGDDDTASLLVQIVRISERTKVRFSNLKLNPAGSQSESEATPTPAPGAQPVSATEAEAALLPLGAAIGPAGLAVMPYTLTFEGSFFRIADFIAEVDRLVKTSNQDVAVDGRLVTLDAFSLRPDPVRGFPYLQSTFSVTTYTTPPGQGLGGGASPASPSPSGDAVPASATIEGEP